MVRRVWGFLETLIELNLVTIEKEDKESDKKESDENGKQKE